MARYDRVPDEVSIDGVANRVRAGLRSVEDPATGANALESGLVTDVSVDGRTVRIAADLAGFDEPTAEEVTETMRRRALSTPGVEHATVEGQTTGGAVHDPIDDLVETIRSFDGLDASSDDPAN